MVRKDEALEESDVIVEDEDVDPDEDIDVDDVDDAILDDVDDDVLVVDDEADVDVVEDEDPETDDETDEALDELEAEELELLAEEAEDSLLIDEAAEMREIRRAELAMNVGAQEARGDEFVCSSCFLVKRTSQLANKRKLICRDCE